MADDLAGVQALKYAEGLRELYGEEKAQRRRAEDALAEIAGLAGKQFDPAVVDAFEALFRDGEQAA